MSKVCIADLDGTIADIRMRIETTKRQFEESDPKFWIYCNAFINTDTPIDETKEFLLDAHTKNKIIIVSGRRNETLRRTIKWLNDHGIPFNEIYLRPVGMNAGKWKDAMFTILDEIHNITLSIGDTDDDEQRAKLFKHPFRRVG